MEVTRRALWATCAVLLFTCALTANAQANPTQLYDYQTVFGTIQPATTVEEGTNAKFVWFADGVGSESVVHGFDQNLTSVFPYPEEATLNGNDSLGAADPAGELSINVGGLAYDPNNERLYVADTDNNRVLGYPRVGAAPYFDIESADQQPGPIGIGDAGESSDPGAFNHPQGLAYNWVTDKLYVADTGNGRIQVFDSNGSGFTWDVDFFDDDFAWNDFDNGPTALAIYPTAGRLYTAEYGSPTIREFSTGLNMQNATLDTGGAQIYSLAVDENAGTLLAAASQSILVFSINSRRLLGTLPGSTITAPDYYAGISASLSRTLYTSVQRTVSTVASTWDLGARPSCPAGAPLTVAPGQTISFSPTCTGDDAALFKDYELGGAPTLGSASVQTGPDRIEFTAGMTEGAGNVQYSVTTANGAAEPQYVNQTINIAKAPTQLPAPPAGADPPTYKDDANLARSTGTVLVKLPGSGVYENVASTAAVPLGTIVDARNGVAVITWAKPDGTIYTGQFSGGVFEIKQETGKNPYAVVKLRDDLVNEAKFARLAMAIASGSAAGQFDAYIARKKGKKKNKVWGNAKGKFRTDGSNSSASVRGTEWLVENYANGTRTYVKSGFVDVKNYKTKKVKRIKKGKSIFVWR